MNEMENCSRFNLKPNRYGNHVAWVYHAAKSDIHLEADIHAVKGNKNGFGDGEWMPYLTINYTLVNADTGENKKVPSCQW